MWNFSNFSVSERELRLIKVNRVWNFRLVTEIMLRHKKLTLLNRASVCFKTNRISCLPYWHELISVSKRTDASFKSVSFLWRTHSLKFFVDIWRDFGGQKLWYKSSLPPCVIHILKALGMLFDMVEPWMGHTIGKFWVIHVSVSLVFLVFLVFSRELLT